MIGEAIESACSTITTRRLPHLAQAAVGAHESLSTISTLSGCFLSIATVDSSKLAVQSPHTWLKQHSGSQL
jgi:hypothetical protein